jgi:hypothetical protein
MTDSFERGLKALAFYWLSLHGIGFMMFTNGQTSRDNWLWGVLSSIFLFEAWVIGIVASGFVIYGLYEIYSFISLEINEPPPRTETELKLRFEPNPKPIYEPIYRFSEPPAVPIVEPLKPKPKPIPPPPTPEELKRKALRQITGKEFS